MSESNEKKVNSNVPQEGNHENEENKSGEKESLVNTFYVLPDEVNEYLKSKDIFIGRILGAGSTSVVCESKHRNEKLAAKIVDKNNLSDLYVEKFLPSELNIIKELKHPFIIKHHFVFTYEQRYVFIFMEFADDGDLISLLEREGKLSRSKSQKWFTQTVSAIKYLHSRGIAHCDIKADNILLQKDGIRLTDFGYARKCYDSDGNLLLSDHFCGTLEYKAPEELIMAPFDALVSDCFSLGVLLFIMTTNEFPFGCGKELRSEFGRRQLLETQMKQRWILPDDLQDDRHLYSLLKQLLNPDVAARITSNQILSHPWFCTK